MKQNPLPAKFRSTLIAASIITVIVTASACATRPRSTPAVQAHEAEYRTGGTSAININTASKSELEKLPGVGTGLAERIITHRQQYGPFHRPEHLMMVRGISDGKFRELRTMIVVE
ncbi:MAG TPA: helix-hairpin-helix domain-containing protein [Pyrinomonadaceae bacterium]|nr:helix-hairpin-helix domain-containing protein [Pyrinomonadaceae bacterium]